MSEILIKNEQDTEAFAKELVKNLKPGDVIALIGDLGVGKTTLTKYIAKGLGIEEMITSPTFNIVSEYKGSNMNMYHFDVYRLESSEDIFERGIEEYFYKKGVCIVEWADMIAEILPDDTKCIFMEYGDKEGECVYQCTY